MESTNTALVVQSGEAVGAQLTDGAFELLADGGAVSASRLTLVTGADGAPPPNTSCPTRSSTCWVGRCSSGSGTL